MALSHDSQLARVSAPKSALADQSRYRVGIALIACAVMAIAILTFSSVAQAAPAAGEDQYLEQAPDGGGNSGSGGSGGTENFSQSVGSNDGTVTEDDVKAKAKKNKKKNADSSAKSTKPVVNETPTTPPAATESVATAAKLGPFSRNTTLALLALIIAIAAGAIVLRNRASVPPGDGTPGSGV
jgi:hypothetical protein